MINEIEYKSKLLNDKWAIETVFKGRKNGFFVEAGVQNPIVNSSCYVLEKHYGWKGICVEPNSHYYARCLKARPGSIVVNVAVADKDGTAVFVETALGGYSGLKERLIAVENKAKQEGWRKDMWRTGGDYREVEVTTLTLDHLLKKNNAPKIIDYIAMDIEGSEYPSLRAFPFEEHKVLCLSIEGRSCNELLKSKGFVHVKNEYNTLGPWEQYFVHKEIMDERFQELN